jgi:hypothetical protein
MTFNKFLACLQITSLLALGGFALILNQESHADRIADREEIRQQIEAAHAAATSRDVQRAILKGEINALAAAIPATALEPIKQPAVMRAPTPAMVGR